MTLASLLAFALALIVAAAIPGPGVTALVASALGSCFRRTVPVIVGNLAYMITQPRPRTIANRIAGTTRAGAAIAVVTR